MGWSIPSTVMVALGIPVPSLLSVTIPFTPLWTYRSRIQIQERCMNTSGRKNERRRGNKEINLVNKLQQRSPVVLPILRQLLRWRILHTAQLDRHLKAVSVKIVPVLHTTYKGDTKHKAHTHTHRPWIPKAGEKPASISFWIRALYFYMEDDILVKDNRLKHLCCVRNQGRKKKKKNLNPHATFGHYSAVPFTAVLVTGDNW